MEIDSLELDVEVLKRENDFLINKNDYIDEYDVDIENEDFV